MASEPSGRQQKKRRRANVAGSKSWACEGGAGRAKCEANLSKMKYEANEETKHLKLMWHGRLSGSRKKNEQTMKANMKMRCSNKL